MKWIAIAVEDDVYIYWALFAAAVILALYGLQSVGIHPFEGLSELTEFGGGLG
jgi:hypothetical protein